MAQDLREAITAVADRPGPVFSAYVSVNAALPENQKRAYLVRMRDAMNDLGVPEEVQTQVREHTEAETTQGPARSCSSRRRTGSSKTTGCTSTCPSRSGGAIPTWPP